MPSRVVPHYQPCLLVFILTIDMPVGVVLHYRPCLLVNCYCNQYFTSRVQMDKGGYKSGATCTEVPLYQTCLMIQCHTQICLLVQCKYIRHACWVHEFIYACLLSAVLSSKISGLLQIHQTCLQVEYCSHTVLKLVGYHPGRHLVYIKF